jgi:hypothetical protein
VSWISHVNDIAIGSSCGDVMIYDIAQVRRLRTMTDHDTRVGD